MLQDLPAESGTKSNGRDDWKRVGGLLIALKMQAQFVIYSWV
jgi:hypothetical protein